MKKVIYNMAALLMALPLTATAQHFRINISEAHFTMPIMEKWVEEYHKVDPTFEVEFVSQRGESADVLVSIGNQQPGTASHTAVARYLILPIANASNDIIQNKKVQKGLTPQLAKEIFIEKDLDELLDEDPAQNRLPGTVYTLTGSKATTTQLFAESLSSTPSRLKGKKVLGREENVLTAVQNHADAVSFNVANLIYDLQSRQPVEGLYVFAVDLNNNGKISEEERLATHDLDALTAFLENSPSTTVPTGEVNIILNDGTADKLNDFVQWIVREGQHYAAEYGYLKAQGLLTAQK